VLHRRRELAACALSFVPVGGVSPLSGSLGVPVGAVAAARAVLDGAERRLDLLVDDSDGVVLGALCIPSPPSRPSAPVPAGAPGEEAGGHPWLRTCQSLVRTLASRPSRLASAPATGPSRLRIEVDGVCVVDLDQPVEAVSVTPGEAGCGAEIEVRAVSAGTGALPLRLLGHKVTVSGADFRYRADSVVSGPVRTRTWTVRESAWGLTLPART